MKNKSQEILLTLLETGESVDFEKFKRKVKMASSLRNVVNRLRSRGAEIMEYETGKFKAVSPELIRSQVEQ